jgi:hypothetical protein
LAEPLLRNPITGIAACCARAVSGHAITVLLKSVMNSRRLMGFTPVAENHLPVSLIRFWCESYAPHCSKKGAPMSALGQSRRWPGSACPVCPNSDMGLNGRAALRGPTLSGLLAQQVRHLGDVRRDPPRLIAVSSFAADRRPG